MRTSSGSLDLDVPCRRQIEHFLEELELDPHSFAEPVLEALEDAYANAALEILPNPGLTDRCRRLKNSGQL